MSAADSVLKQVQAAHGASLRHEREKLDAKERRRKSRISMGDSSGHTKTQGFARKSR